MLLSLETYQKIDKEIAKFPAKQRQSAVIAALALAQDQLGWLSPETMQEVADYLAMPAIAVQEVATFYNMFHTKPLGRFTLTVCTNLPCALSGANKAAQYVQKKLGIGFNETTPDHLFTLVEGECMGACGDAPVMLLNNQHMCSFMSEEKIDDMLNELKDRALQPTLKEDALND